MKFWTINIRLTLRIIGWVQIIGGITGILLIGRLMLNTGAINGPVLLIFHFGLGLFIFSIYTGKKLLSESTKLYGIIFSLINYFFQLFQWSILGYGFTYSSGAEFIIGIKAFSLSFNLAVITSSFRMSINSGNEFFVQINIIAVVMLLVLFDLFKEIKKGQEVKKVEFELEAV